MKGSGNAWIRRGTSGSWIVSGNCTTHLGRSGSKQAMRVLVTGHNGYLGSVMVKVLQSAGHQVLGLGKYFFASCGTGEKQQNRALCKDGREVGAHQFAGLGAGC